MTTYQKKKLIATLEDIAPAFNWKLERGVFNFGDALFVDEAKGFGINVETRFKMEGSMSRQKGNFDLFWDMKNKAYKYLLDNYETTCAGDFDIVIRDV